MTRGTWAAVVASAGLTVGAGGASVHAIHVTGDTPLAIAPADLQRYREGGEDVVIVDLRSSDAFRAGHLPRARSLPLGELRRREAEVPRVGRVVLYAATPEEAAAAYRALREAGHRNVMVLGGGLPAWIRLGLPLEAAR
ncbi:MAG TPA: rhodanese-like domain-containing protein [Methylomirabilota bacterium]|jgi:rhodanese-related sulfurtransferase|nr:rhodanese-like domain-containing protein [Methylomirabilota bacterium]